MQGDVRESTDIQVRLQPSDKRRTRKEERTTEFNEDEKKGEYAL